MNENKSQTFLGKAPVLSYQTATLLDVPLIFQLTQEGAEAGAFSADFVARTGSVKLLAYILRSIIRQYFQSGKAGNRSVWQAITQPNGETVGFLKLTRDVNERGDVCLEILAVSPAHRNQGIGTAVLHHVASMVPNEARLIVYCTKYARAMQHILKRSGFKRNVKWRERGVEEYRTVPDPEPG